VKLVTFLRITSRVSLVAYLGLLVTFWVLHGRGMWPWSYQGILAVVLVVFLSSSYVHAEVVKRSREGEAGPGGKGQG